ncbi:MAG TPA: TolC family protein [Pirellulales bacterium]|nr:TolC family protein [Pirellulales bacterium]
MPIDLGTALRLANANNLQVALAREQIRQSLAQLTASKVLWLPSLRMGGNYNRFDGAIQNVNGTQFNTSRSMFYTGAGALAFPAASPAYPGLYANFSLADALFQPLAARQFSGAQRQASTAATNDALLAVASGYLELLRSNQEQAIAVEIEQLARRLADLTADYARTGEGLQADADRLLTEWTVRQNDVARADEAVEVASARLVQLLHIGPDVLLEPVEPAVVAIEMVPSQSSLREMVAQGLSRRPELAESRLLVGRAVSLLRRERLAPLIPSVILGASYGGMSAGVYPNLAGMTGRVDADAAAYWQLRNLGFGERAARENAGSVLRQAEVRQLAQMDLVAREITEAHAQVRNRRRRIETARIGVEAALNSHQRNLARIMDAKGLPIEALQSVQALALARREYLQTLIDYDAAQFALYRAIGAPTGWSPAPTPRTP